MNYQLASQGEAQYWEDVRALLESTNYDQKGHISQRPKRQLRDNMTKAIEALEFSKAWLDGELQSAKDQHTVGWLKRKVDITLRVQKSRIAQVLLNINDEHSEVQMDLMALQLEESRAAIDQAESVQNLTKLAFIFIPLTTVCSAFGMNLKEMDNHPSIWWFVWISVVCTMAAVIAVSSWPVQAKKKLNRWIEGGPIPAGFTKTMSGDLMLKKRMTATASLQGKVSTV